jgi:hypothetical protein
MTNNSTESNKNPDSAFNKDMTTPTDTPRTTVVLTKAGIDALRERDEAKKELVAAQAEVEKLKTQLTRTGRIAEKIADEWVSADFFDEHQFIKLRSELSQITANLNP